MFCHIIDKPPGAYLFQARLSGGGGDLIMGLHTAFSNNEKMVSILRKELRRKVEMLKHMT